MHDVDMTGDDDDVEVPRYGSLKRAPPMEAVVEHKLKRLKIQRASSPDGHRQQLPPMAAAAHHQQYHEHRQRQHEEEEQRQAELHQWQYEQQHQHHYHHQLQAHTSQYLTALPARYDPTSPSDVDYARSNQVLRDLHFQRELRKQMTP
ncbi:hypothetical protein SPRG_20242 [Saprolegnia parasitica CBS 223.65]|uniref:Uncharacterized protein n=1 Tax=Saprolegnia parasitica (strain CBS 223.65) TaxID=695850 RepID=A0A067CMN8_SAPPC|nr:hypothetical protein SPRG_20242 [Saprolegnia parasitica CBS 223.65]KDO28082.1 hypothetical protein SPRG_20242 [Saprolegnia parasitica CBS 223.65]|eukprot:XP_012201228.1 hypothetical protein SPRG_20242 [Saprolegnia parasitica CBS 223.65]